MCDKPQLTVKLINLCNADPVDLTVNLNTENNNIAKQQHVIRISINETT